MSIVSKRSSSQHTEVEQVSNIKCSANMNIRFLPRPQRSNVATPVEAKKWSGPIGKPNEFEAELRPAHFSHMAPLSVNGVSNLY